MQSKATTVTEYMDSLPEERKAAMLQLRDTINENLPVGFKETIGYGMIGWVIPHSDYPAGYHCDPKLPLPFMNLASQKNFIALYHMGIYSNPELLAWFTNEYPKHCKTKLDMGKSCIRFKKMNDIPLELIGELAAKVTPEMWIEWYEKVLNRQ
ncbi:MAG: hypothetical protein A3D31_19245 [Candidatus Fluviicola riflensis]|nr:MAG: hypothetical protein CHH17_05970 [Candidatus Fluviicola riflensis]OGS75924.1 MAG: hypothetical protein A3D31_19245 [Candidatus Fluviicola riflensis]OGS83604.1 MAG: hypothetical protein A2724_19260 [Fluviicola sp. RIFCSPHIGHO2_01_FULL_43_53]OGS85743.1 MAG: hypothetical protein A3E30_18790 [Fluviicola sp. RIFCSPHIGHO2_12_FULL_43_24]